MANMNNMSMLASRLSMSCGRLVDSDIADMERTRGRSSTRQRHRHTKPEVHNVKQTATNLCTTQLKPLFGRQPDVDAVCEMLIQPQRPQLVLLTGCPGIGKASLALAVAARLATTHTLVPFIVDARGAPTCDGIFRRLLRLFGVRFRLNELSYLCHWFNAQQQKPLFVFNNVDVTHGDECVAVSRLMDRLSSEISEARILCTSGRNFYTSPTPGASEGDGEATKPTCCVYSVADLGHEGTKRVVLSLAPDLHEQGVDELTLACDNVLLGVYLTAKACLLPDVDPGQLFVDVTTMDNGVLDPDKVRDVAGLAANEDISRCKLANVLGVIERVILNLPPAHQNVLEMTSVFASYFDISSCGYMTGLPEQCLTKVLNELVDTGFLLMEQEQLQNKSKSRRYYVEGFIKLVARAICEQRQHYADAVVKYCAYFCGQLFTMCTRFWSASVSDVVSDFDDNFDNYVDVIRHVISHDVIIDRISNACVIENVIFYATVLPVRLLFDFYDWLRKVADISGNGQTQVDALCALSYCYAETGKIDIAQSQAQRAFALLQSAPSLVDKTFCWQCLGRVLWHEQDASEKARALMLLKRAQETTQASCGVEHVRTIIANEFYASVLTQAGKHHMARHFYNVTDVALGELGEHPFLLQPGFDCRLVIWDRFGLFRRSADVSRRAAKVALRYHGDHPLTATWYARYSHCLLGQGEVYEATRACVTSLNIRRRVLGQHVDTAWSFKTLASLLLKRGRSDEALRYCHLALDMCSTLKSVSNADCDAIKADVRDVMKQAYCRQATSRNRERNGTADKNDVINGDRTPEKRSYESTSLPRHSSRQKENLRSFIDKFAAVV